MFLNSQLFVVQKDAEEPGRHINGNDHVKTVSVSAGDQQNHHQTVSGNQAFL
jgi:hypothetical protein